MYQPTDSDHGRSEMVIVRHDGGYALGRFTGETRERSESYQVDVINHITEEVRDTRHFHKEDIYELTSENTERFQGQWVRK